MQAKLIAAGVCALAFVALIAVALFYRGQYISAEASYKAQQEQTKLALDANAAQQKVIQRITEQRQADDKIIADFTEALQNVTAQSDEVKTSITNLERGNNEVRSYLAIHVPSDLAKLLTRPASGNKAGTTGNTGTRRVNSPLRAAATPKH